MTVQFYDDRYAHGYMERWPREKIDRIKEVIAHLHLPAEGAALDYGCGNGVFTAVLKDVLPHWTVYGADISVRAIANARQRVVNCTFFTMDQIPDVRFDFIFSHHVLEHVDDIAQSIADMHVRASTKASMLHILPCGNPDSFEWRVCHWRRGGIDQESRRFYFEDKGHVRRMTRDELTAHMGQHGSALAKAYFANQYFGAWDWITRCPVQFIARMFNPFYAKNFSRACAIMCYGLGFLLLRVLCFRPLITVLAQHEWAKKKTFPNGSEMYLYFVR